MLRDWDRDGLVVRCGVDGRELVSARRNTPGYLERENPILGRGIDALEKCELCRVQNVVCGDRLQRLDDKVAVTYDLAILIQLLWRSEVVRIRIREDSRLHVDQRHFDRERRVGLQGIEVIRGREFARGHVLVARDIAHGHWVTRASLNLLTVGDRLPDAEIDEVIGRGERGCLASGCILLAVAFEALGEHTIIQA